jgi:hypothetical protein
VGFSAAGRYLGPSPCSGAGEETPVCVRVAIIDRECLISQISQGDGCWRPLQLTRYILDGGELLRIPVMYLVKYDVDGKMVQLEGKVTRGIDLTVKCLSTVLLLVCVSGKTLAPKLRTLASCMPAGERGEPSPLHLWTLLEWTATCSGRAE